MRHKTHRNRRKGGVKIQLTKYRNIEELNDAFVRLNGKGELPIPLQKRGICMTDSIIAALWYSDYLGEYLWKTFVFNKPAPEVDTQAVETRGIDQLSQRDAAIKVLLLQAYRVASIMETVQVTKPQRGQLVRLPTGRPEESYFPADIAVGEVCANVMHKFISTRRTVDSFFDRPTYDDAFFYAYHGSEIIEPLQMILQNILGDKVLVSPQIDETKKCVSFWTTSHLHAVACVKVNNTWTWMDNEIGIGIPLDGLTFDDIQRGFFQFNYKFSIGRVEYTLTYSDGGFFGTGSTRQWKKTRVDPSITNVIEATHTEETVNRVFIQVDPTIISDHRNIVEQRPVIVEERLPAQSMYHIKDIVGPLRGVELINLSEGQTVITLPGSDKGVKAVAEGNTMYVYVRDTPVKVGTFSIPSRLDRRQLPNRVYQVIFFENGRGTRIYLDMREEPDYIRGGFRIIFNDLQVRSNIMRLNNSAPRPDARTRAPAVREYQGTFKLPLRSLLSVRVRIEENNPVFTVIGDGLSGKFTVAPGGGPARLIIYKNPGQPGSEYSGNYQANQQGEPRAPVPAPQPDTRPRAPVPAPQPDTRPRAPVPPPVPAPQPDTTPRAPIPVFREYGGQLILNPPNDSFFVRVRIEFMNNRFFTIIGDGWGGKFMRDPKGISRLTINNSTYKGNYQPDRQGGKSNVVSAHRLPSLSKRTVRNSSSSKKRRTRKNS
jgi:hypothetical protein